MILASIALMVLFLAGCGGSASDPMLDIDYRQGTDGLTMEFIDNMPTRSVYAGEQFNIGIQIENEGAHDIGMGKIMISGYEQGQYEFEGDNSREFQLRGRTQFEPKGELDHVIIGVRSICYPEMASQVRTNLTTTFRATACYTYATVANAQVCIDTNPLVTQSGADKICQVKAVTLSGGQGGPVAVTKVEPSMIPTGQGGITARFLIYLKNLNTDGTVYALGAYDTDCEDTILKNKVVFGAKLAEIPLICTPQGEITIRSGEDTVVSCETPLTTAGGVYETQLTMGLEYAYSQDATTTVNVNKPLDVNIPACN